MTALASLAALFAAAFVFAVCILVIIAGCCAAVAVVAFAAAFLAKTWQALRSGFVRGYRS